MKGVTIDQLEMKDHVRWAKDQSHLDVSLIKEAELIAHHHPEILGTSVIYPSKLEELFELQKKNLHWASFEPPKNFHLFSKRFFSYRLFPNLDWEEEEEEEKDQDQELMEEVAKAQSPDKDAILNLLKSVGWISRLLKQINARKLQYQKG